VNAAIKSHRPEVWGEGFFFFCCGCIVIQVYQAAQSIAWDFFSSLKALSKVDYIFIWRPFQTTLGNNKTFNPCLCSHSWTPFLHSAWMSDLLNQHSNQCALYRGTLDGKKKKNKRNPKKKAYTIYRDQQSFMLAISNRAWLSWIWIWNWQCKKIWIVHRTCRVGEYQSQTKI